MNNTVRTAIIANLMESIQDRYQAEHDLFDDEIQVNVTDMRLLRIVSYQQAIIEELAASLARLEVFTGMVAPAPLPVDRIAAQQASDAEFDDSMSMHFVNGEVDYIEPGALIDNDTDELPY